MAKPEWKDIQFKCERCGNSEPFVVQVMCINRVRVWTEEDHGRKAVETSQDSQMWCLYCIAAEGGWNE